MKILYILPEFHPHPGGGIATFYQNLLPQLKKAGIQCEVLVGSGFCNGKTKTNFKDIPVTYLDPDMFKSYKIKLKKFDLFPEIQNHLAAAWAMYAQTDGGSGYSLVETVDWGLGYVPWVLKRNIPVVTRLHGSCSQIEDHDPRQNFSFWADFIRINEFTTLPLSDCLLTYSINNKTFWEENLREKIEYIPPVYQNLNDDNFNNIQFLTQNSEYATVVGRIQKWKGPEILCQAMKLSTTPIKIFWVGRDTDYLSKGNSYNQYLKSKYPDVWGTKIIPVGQKSYADTFGIMKKSKFGIVCSTWDMFNFTTLEWMSLGKALICSKGAGAWNHVEASGGGRIYNEADADTLFKNIDRFWEKNEHDLNRLGRKNVEYLDTYLLPEEIAKENIRIYRSVQNTKREKRHSNLASIFIPSNERSNRNETLNQWPLRQILKYTIKRLKAKSFGK